MASLNPPPTPESTPHNSASQGVVSHGRKFVVALAGNPNSGKTTLFNLLTGSKYKVANYPGVTVERREGRISSEHFRKTQPPTGASGMPEIEVVDLPGIYSLSGVSIDERLAAESLFDHQSNSPRPDAVVCVIDSTNLERNLFLVTQLIDCGLPVIAALNMTDLAEKQGVTIHREIFSRELGVPVVSIVAREGRGISELLQSVLSTLAHPTPSPKAFSWLSPGHPYRVSATSVGDKWRDIMGVQTEAPSLYLGSSLFSEALPTPTYLKAQIDKAREELTSQAIDSYSYETTKRYHWINEVVRRSVARAPHTGPTLSDKIDRIVTHKIFGTAIFFVIMAVMFQSIFTWASPIMDAIDGLVSELGSILGESLPDGLVKSLLVDGVIAGVGSVLVFIPQIAILTLFLSILEDTGYLTRAAFLMDRLLRPVGLQGRSFIPLLSSFACAIPGIMATRTIPSWSDRIATILVAPLMSCSARLPVYAVLIAAVVPNVSVFGFFSLQGLTLLGMYLLGIFGAAFVAWVLKLSVLRGKPALFVMEMPPFRRPAARVVFRQVYDSVTSFVKSAGTVILACSIVLWFLASFPKPPAGHEGSKVEASYAGQIGKLIEPAIAPLGYNWELGVSLIASFAAREVFVSSLATVYNLETDSDSNQSLIQTLRSKNAAGTFSTSTALSLMVFFVFACQCMSTIAICRRETGSWAWTGLMFGYMTVLAYGAAFVVYHGAEYFLGAV